MADEVPSNVTNSVVYDNKDSRRLWRRANGATIFPCAPVTETGETYPDVSLLSDYATDIPLGVADCKQDHDIDTCYADNEWFPIVPCGSDNGVYVIRVGDACGVAVVSGDSCVAAAEDGLVMHPLVAATNNLVIGRFEYPHAADTSYNIVCKIRLSK